MVTKCFDIENTYFCRINLFSGTLSSMLMQSIGKPKSQQKSHLIQLILLITIFPLSYFMGISGLVFCLIITNSYSMLHSLTFVMKVMQIHISKVIYILLSTINAVAFLLPITFVKLYLFSFYNITTLCFFIVFGIILFISLQF